MAELKSIGMNKGRIELKLIIDQDEYMILRNHTSDLAVVPFGKGALTRELTTGKLGNSNRIMVPKKFLEANEIDKLDKKVPSKVFCIGGNKFLLIKVRKSQLGVPKFKGD